MLPKITRQQCYLSDGEKEDVNFRHIFQELLKVGYSHKSMKSPHFSFRTFIAASLSLALPSMATDYQWDGNGATAGWDQGVTTAAAWNTSALTWDSLATGINDGTEPPVAVTFTAADNAIFTGFSTTTNRVWALSTNVNLAGLTFGITGGANNTLRSNSTVARTITLNSGTGLTTSGNTTTIGSITQGINLTLAADQTWNIGADTTILNPINETGGARSLTKAGAAILTLSAANNYTGSTVINEGTIRLTDGAQLGSGPVTLGGAASGGGTLQYSLTVPQTETRTLNLGGSSNQLLSLSSIGTAAITWNGNTAFSASSNRTLRLRGGSTADNTFAGVIANSTGGGIVTLTKADAGKWILTGANTYTGGTNINNGSLFLSGAGSLADSTVLSLNAVGATFDMSAISASTEVIASATGVTGSTIGLGNRTLEVGGDNTDFSIGSAITGTNGSLKKVGSGTMTLSGNNTYTGTTNVSGGTLLMGSDNTLPDASALNLSSGTTLKTDGHVDSLGALTVASGSVIDMGAGNASSLTFTDIGTWSGILNIWNYSEGVLSGASLGDKLIFSAQTGTFNLANVRFYSDSGTTPYSSSFGAAFVGNELVPVPEPTAMAAALVLLGYASSTRRRS